MRLIDVDALLTSIYRKYGPIDALEDIRNAPTVVMAKAVEVEVVRYAKWVNGSGGVHCSNCGEKIHYYIRHGLDDNGDTQAYWDFTPYCPVCGSKMEDENA